MKKIFLAIFMFVFSIQLVNAANIKKDYSLLFNKERFHLLYSTKNPDFGGYLNEYYKKGETYNIWSEMVAVHHFPNAYSPIDRIKDFKDYLASMKIPSSLTFDDKRNSAIIDFIVITDNQMPIVLEFNVFKYEKSKKCGSVALQYVKRYAATTTMQIEEIKKDFEKNRKSIINKVRVHKIPAIVTEDIDKCISGIDVNSRISEKIPENSKKDTIDETIKESEIIKEIDETPTEKKDVTVSEKTENSEAISDNTKKDENIKNNENEVSDTSDLNEKQPEEIVKNNNKEESASEQLSINNEKEKKEEEQQQNNSMLNNQEKMTNKEVNETSNLAPIPYYNKEIKEKNIKNANYIIANSKDNFIAKPRTKKELKQYKKEQKKLRKLRKKGYTVTNNKEEYISAKRTKKEMKQYVKAKKLAKKRAKKAKKMLED